MKLPAEIVRKYYKYYGYTDNFAFVQNGSRTTAGWQSVSTGSDFLYGSSNAYEMGQWCQTSLVYTYNNTIPATTYTFNVTISGQGNGYFNNPTVTVTYENDTQEVVYSKSWGGSSLNETFTFTATTPIKRIALTGALTHSSKSYVVVYTTFKSISHITEGVEEATENDYDFYRDEPVYKAVYNNNKLYGFYGRK